MPHQVPEDLLVTKKRKELAEYKHQWYIANRDRLREKNGQIPRTDLSHLSPEEKKAYKAAQNRTYRETNKDAIRAKRQAKYAANKEREKVRNHENYVRHRPKRLEAMKQWAADNPEPVRKIRQRHKDKNREELRAKGREYAAKKRAADPDKVRQEQNAYNAANRKKVNERARNHRAKKRDILNARQQQKRREHPEKDREWRKAHPEASRLKESRRRARKRQLPDTFTKEQRQFMLQYWHHACAVCGNQDGFFWTLADDHWIPITSPHCPGTVATNMIPLCDGQGGCNTLKRNKDARAWLATRYTPAQAKRILKSIETYFTVVRQRFNLAAAD